MDIAIKPGDSVTWGDGVTVYPVLGVEGWDVWVKDPDGSTRIVTGEADHAHSVDDFRLVEAPPPRRISTGDRVLWGRPGEVFNVRAVVDGLAWLTGPAFSAADRLIEPVGSMHVVEDAP